MYEGPKREIIRKMPPPVYTCRACGSKQSIIGKGKGWNGAPGGGWVCPKDVCRDTLGVPRLKENQ